MLNAYSEDIYCHMMPCITICAVDICELITLYDHINSSISSECSINSSTWCPLTGEHLHHTLLSSVQEVCVGFTVNWWPAEPTFNDSVMYLDLA